MPEKNTRCPACNSERPSAISEKLCLCKNCGVIYNTAYRQRVYDDTYFLNDYKEQYGKTYKEDYNNIYSLAERRLDVILDMLPKNADPADLHILDVGSALGFSLKCARDKGIGRQTGIEISGYASGYCRSEFGIDVINRPFEEAAIHQTFDIITAWFFIEHTENPVATLRSMYDMLSSGGILAFSLPSYFGPLYTFDRKKFIQTHPVDHRIDFSPASIKRYLRQTGFSSIRVKPSGIHPERVFNERSALYPLYASIYRAFSKIFAYSDTIEVYAVK